VNTPALGAELEALRTELEERTRDLQRVTAEYANYRKRVDRDRSVAAEQTTGSVLISLLPVLDDIDRAREHGDLVGPFAAVAEALNAAVGKYGLIAFGEKGDPFDPTRHEAVAHLTSPDVKEPTCVEVMRRGYILGERLLRPALVAVADPE
jgi:molecular chaperone GrpE